MPQTCAHYYVDEAGDLTLFNKKGRIIIGEEGVSHLFMVGVAYLPFPERAATLLNQLRTELLADPYFRNVPSMNPAVKKNCHLFPRQRRPARGPPGSSQDSSPITSQSSGSVPAETGNGRLCLQIVS